MIEAVTRAADAEKSWQFCLVLALLVLGTTLPLAGLRPWPSVTVAFLAGLLSIVPFAAPTAAGILAQVVGLYRLGRNGYQLLPAALAALSVALAVVDPVDGRARILLVLLAATAPFAGWAGAARRARLWSAAQQADRRQIDGTLLEHVARGERARIAREVHDVVAHHISVVVVEAESARLTTADLPAVGAQRLSAIAGTARSALTEMRRLLGVLREDIGSQVPVRQPQPGLGQLNELLDEARSVSGIGARMILRGIPQPLDPGVELAVYRIVQEALTNVRRHAPASAVDVELHYGPDTVRVRVRDNGPGPSESPDVGRQVSWGCASGRLPWAAC
ncbi:MAG: sensor histidine kinase [Nakamurella sp.]